MASDAAGTDNTAAVPVSVPLDGTAPGVEITGLPDSARSGVTFTVTYRFSEDIGTSFDIADVRAGLGNATASNLSTTTAGRVFTAEIMPTGSGDVEVLVPASAVQDAAGNGNMASAVQTVPFTGTDTIAPTTAISGAPDRITGTAAFEVTVRFSEPVLGFEAGDVNVVNGVAGAPAQGADAGNYRVAITPDGSGDITIDIPANAARDAADNGNVAAPQVRVAYDATAPTITSVVRRDPTGQITNADTLTWRVTFSEAVDNVNASAFEASGTTATLTSVVRVGATNSYDIRVSGGDLAGLDGDVTLGLAAGHGIADTFGNALVNTATAPGGADERTYTLDNRAPLVAVSEFRRLPSGDRLWAFTISVTDNNLDPASMIEASALDLSNNTTDLAVSGAGTTHTGSFRATAGALFVGLRAGAVRDLAGNLSPALPQAHIPEELAAVLAVNITGAPPAIRDRTPFAVTYSFSGNVATSFNIDDVRAGLRNATASEFRTATAGTVFTALITPDGQGDVILDVPAGAARDSQGNGNTAAPQVVVRLAEVGVRVSRREARVAENGGMETWTIVLDSQPTGTVTVTPASSDDTIATVSAPLTFTTGNWNQPQTVTVRGINDDLDNDGDQRSATISHAASGGGYDGVQVDDVTVTVRDDDDDVPPTVISILRHDPAGKVTDADALTWRVTFSEPVQNVVPAAFVLSATTATVTSVVRVGTTNSYDIRVSGGNLSNRNRDLWVQLAGTQRIVDVAGNPLTNRFPTSTDVDDRTYRLDNRPPEIAIGEFRRLPSRSTNRARHTHAFTITVTEANLDPDSVIEASDINLGDNTEDVAVSGSGTTYTVSFRVTGGNRIRAEIRAGVVRDLAGNESAMARSARIPRNLSGLPSAGPAVDITGAPPATQGRRPFAVRYSFSEDVGTSFDIADVQAGLSNATASGFRTVPARAGREFTALITPDGQGDVTIDVPAGVAQNAGDNGNTAAPQVVVRYNAQGGVTVSQRELTVAEAAGRATYRVVMAGQLSAGDVIVTPQSSDTSVATVSGPLRFTRADWNVPKTVMVTGVDDDLDNPGDRRVATITHAVTGGGDVDDVRVTVTDDDSAGIAVSAATNDATTNEAGGTVQFRVALTSQPTADVMIGLSSSDPEEGSVDRPGLTFTPANWNVPQTVTVTGQGSDMDGDRTYRILIAPAISEDAVYDGWDAADIELTNAESELQVASLVRIQPQSTYGNGTRLVWRLTFTKPVRGVAADDFAVSGLAGPQIDVEPVGSEGRVYDVSVSGGGLATVDGRVVLSLRPDRTIEGTARSLALFGDLPPQANFFVVNNDPLRVTALEVPGSIHDRAAFAVRVIFSKNVEGFGPEGLAVTGGSATDVSGSGSVYRVEITPDGGTGDLTVAVAQDAARDRFGNLNEASAPAIVSYDATALTAVLSGTPAPLGRSWEMTIAFSRPVDGLVLSDFETEGADILRLVGTGTPVGGRFSRYTATVRGEARGYHVHLPSGSVSDERGAQNTPSNRIGATDTRPPTVQMTLRPHPQDENPRLNGARWLLDLRFSEPVTGLGFDDFNENTDLENLRMVPRPEFFPAGFDTNGGRSYRVVFFAHGVNLDRAVTLPAGAVTDLWGNPVAAARTVSMVDFEPPTLRLSGTPQPPGVRWTMTLEFSKPVRYEFKNPIELVQASTFGATSVNTLMPVGEPAFTRDDEQYFYRYQIDIIEGADKNIYPLQIKSSRIFYDVFGSRHLDSNILNYSGDAGVPSDTVRPTATLAGQPQPAGIPWTMTVEFPEPVTGLTPASFEADGADLSGIVQVGETQASGGIVYYQRYRATVTGRQDLYSVRLRENAAYDLGNNGNLASNTLVGDFTPPLVSDVFRQQPTSSRTNADTLVWRIIFSEPVTGVDGTDFDVSGTSADRIAVAPVGADGTTYDVTLSGGDLADASGRTIRPDLSDTPTITDLAGNQLSGGLPEAAASLAARTYLLDNIAPTISVPAEAITAVVGEDDPNAIIDFRDRVSARDDGDPLLGETEFGFAALDIASAPVRGLTSGSAFPAGTTTVTVRATDLVGNTATARFDVVVLIAPSVAISGTPETAGLNPFDITLTFSKAVSGFEAGDVTVVNGSAGNLRGSGAQYRVAITPDGNGNLEIGVAAGVASDAAGTDNTAAAPVSVPLDGTAPGVEITGLPDSARSGVTFTVTYRFSEDIGTSFDIADVRAGLGNATASNLSTTTAGRVFTAEIMPTGSGDVEVLVPASAVQDAAGNGNMASAVQTVPFTGNVARPVFTSGAASSAPENAVATGYTAQANAAAGSVSYAITGGADAQRFEINASTGVVRFVAAPDFEVPGDDGGDNVYAFAVTATATSADGSARETATQDVEVRVTNVDEPTAGAVSIVNASRADEPVREGDALRADTSAITDGDGVDSFTYEWRRDGAAIPGATQATYTAMADDVGAPLSVAVVHTDAAGNEASAIVSVATAAVEDDVSNNVARPVFTSGAAFSAPENAVATGYTAQANAAAGSVRYAITGGADAQRFEINASTGVVRFVAAPDFEVPGDDDGDNVYAFAVTATATSADGSARETATQDVEVRVTNVDEPTEGAVSIVNASRAGEAVREGDALRADTSAITDGDGVGGFTYEWRRDGTPVSGETGQTYTAMADDVGAPLSVAVVHTDAVGNEASAIVSVATAAVEDDVSNNVARPVFTSGAASSAPENAVATGYTAQANAAAGAVTYSITGGADAQRFEINASTGVVRFVAAPDFEVPGDDDGDNVYAFAVTATATSVDGSARETATQDVEVRVTNVDEPTAGAVSIVNASRAGEAVREGDALRADTSAITDGDGVGGFTYEWRRDGTPIPGETQATYTAMADDVGAPLSVAVVHTDAAGNEASAIVSVATAAVEDDVSNNVARPVFTSGAASSAPENAVATGYTAQANAAAGSVRYAITGGADAQRFEINASTGVVRFVAAPDFEVPGDDDGDNVYAFAVTATATSADGSASETATQDVEVRVTNVDEPTGGAVSIVNASRAGEPVREGDALRADTSAITDGDGVGGFTYEWRRDGTPISGATQATYDTGAADVGREIRVVATHTDVAGHPAGAILSPSVSVLDDDSNNVARPVFTSGAASSAPENAVATGYTAQANAAAGAVTYSITGGADAQRFEINASTGVVRFVAAPDFEVPGDDGGDNVYAFAVTATARSVDGSARETATQDVEVRVTNVDEPTAGAVSIVNASRAGEPAREGDALRADTSAITDGDGVGGFTYEWRRDGTPVSGATQATYDTGAADVGREIRVAATHTDVAGHQAGAILSPSVSVLDDVSNNVARPVFTSGAASSAPENAVATGYTAQANAAAGSVRYAITGGADAQRFEINASTGVVRFVAAPDFEVPGDDGGDNVYAFAVTATARSVDGSARETATQDVEIRVTNVDEPTEGAVSIVNASRAGEPVREGDALRADTSAITDGDGVGGFTYEWRRDGAAIPGATQATYTAMADDVGAPLSVAVVHTDAAGNEASAIVSVATAAVEDDVSNNVARPVFTSGAASSAPENAVATGYTAQADASAGSVRYAITGGADAQRFEINASTGVVSFVAAPDFEVPGDDDGDNVYAFEVTATATSVDGSARETATQDVEVRVTNVDEPTAGAVSIVNASRAGEAVREGDALRADTSAITDGDGVGGFTYEWRRDGTPIPGETQATYTAMADDVGAPLSVAVVHTDAAGNEASAIVSVATAAVEDDVSNNVARPVFTSGAASSAPENAVATGYTAQANAAAGAVTYSITGGADAQRFEINASTGVVRFVAAPDFEVPGDDDGDNVYAFAVTATATSVDGSARETATQDVEVRVTNVDEPTAGAVSIVNASRAGEAVREGDALRADTSAITDGDGVGGFTYEWRRDGTPISGETQATYDTGAADVGREIRVVATHTDVAGHPAGAILSPSVSVLDDVSNNVARPVFTSGAASSAPENAVATGYTAQANAAAGAVTYSITGGADAQRFEINASTGVVSFVAAPDFEVPGDDGGDNVYAFAVTATATSVDGSARETATQDVEVRVTNVDEPTAGTVSIVNASRAGEPVREGDALRADTSAITDGDGVGGFTYEWRRDGTPIPGETQATYDTGVADVGREIRVAATHTDAAGHQAGAILSPSVSVLDDVSNNVARPVFTSGAASSAPENAVATGYTAQANAAAGSVRYAITGGADAQRFEINASTGVVRFVAAPDFEVPGDDGGDNVYAFAVTATARSVDGSARETATQDVEVRVTNVDEPTAGAVSIVNASRAGEPAREGDALRADTSAITDGDGVGGFTYEWRRDGTPVSGATQATYDTGAADVGREIRVAATHTDVAGHQAGAILSPSVSVLDDVSNNVARPVFTSGAASSAPENAVATGYTAQANAAAGSVRYAITGGADAQRFEINASTGVVRFVAAPDFEVPGDDGGDNVYAFAVTATARSVDGSARETATQDVEIRVTNVDEPTEGAVSIVNASRAGEPVREGDALRADTSAITDGDGVGGFTYEWRRDGTPVSGETGQTYTAMADDVGAPLSVAVVHTDAVGNEASAIVSVATAAVEDDVSNNVARPVFTSGAASSAPENAVATGYRAQANAAAGSVRYAITGGADAQRFEINASTGVVSFVAAPDFEVPGDDDANNVYNFRVTATARSADGSARETATQDVEIRVTNVDEPTEGTVSIVNASRAGEPVREGDALRADTSAITDGDGVGGFTYEWRRDGTPVSGETGQTYTAMADDVGAPLSVAVVHTDAVGNEASAIVSVATAAVEDDVSNNVARPVFTSGAASSAPENAVATGYTAQANAAAGSVSYAITGGADAQRFEINASTGVVSFVAAPDFEVPGDDDGDNVYAFAVTATATSADGSARETATQDVEVRVTNVDEPTEGAVSIVNASRADEAVREGDALRADTSAITDGDGVDSFTYEWRRDGAAIPGATQATYDTGAADVGREIRVAATHTDAAGHQAGAILSPSVSVLDDVSNNVARPVFTSGAAFSAPENAVATGYRAQADAAAGSVSYAITGGADAQRFEINASTGVVSFVAAPDFEVPGDDDANNVYNFRVTATATSADGSARETATQDVEVRVTNVDEPTEGAVSIVNASRAGEPVREGDALRADTSAITDGDGVGGFTYEWRRDGAAIPGETQATYDTGAADVGREIRVAVIHTDSVGNEAGAILSPSVSVLDDVSNNVVRPVFTSGVASSAPENAVATGYTAQADAAAGSVRYAITGGADRDLVAIDAASGVVSFVAAPDFEVPGDDGGDNVYAFAVTATATSADGSASETATQDVEVRVTNVDEPTAGAVSIVNASRAGEPAREGDALRADTSASRMATVWAASPMNGVVTERPSPARRRRPTTPVRRMWAGRSATHTDVAGHQAGAILSPSVSVLDDVSNNVARPVFTSGAASSAPENAVATGYTAQANAAAGSVRYAITGGADAQRFEINASTGVVRFVAAPDFEVPGDDGGDNVYAFAVTATARSVDGSARETATQDVDQGDECRRAVPFPL